MDVLIFHVILPLALEHLQLARSTHSFSSIASGFIVLLAKALGLNVRSDVPPRTTDEKEGEMCVCGRGRGVWGRGGKGVQMRGKSGRGEGNGSEVI